MNASLLSRILTDDGNDAVLLDRWRAERAAEKALAAASDEDAASEPPAVLDAARLAAAVDPYDKTIEPGQIRILAPDLVSDPGNIPYVAVLEPGKPGLCLVAPFSPYSTPATEGEMETGLVPVGQRVLQCWHDRTVAESVVSRSSAAGALPQGALEDARALSRHVLSGQPLPESFSAVVGPPTLSEADPRREHVAESTARFEPLAVATRALEAERARADRFAAFRAAIARRLREAGERAGAIIDAICVPAYGMQDDALAAGDGTRETTETFRAPELGVEIDVDHAPAEGKVRLVAYRNGVRAEDALEGFLLFDKDGDLVGLFEKGVLATDADRLAGGFLLVSPETLEPVFLEPASR